MPRILDCEPGSAEAIKIGAAAAVSGTEVEFRASDQLLYTDSGGTIELRAANAVARLLCECLPAKLPLQATVLGPRT